MSRVNNKLAYVDPWWGLILCVLNIYQPKRYYFCATKPNIRMKINILNHQEELGWFCKYIFVLNYIRLGLSGLKFEYEFFFVREQFTKQRNQKFFQAYSNLKEMKKIFWQRPFNICCIFLTPNIWPIYIV